MPNTFSRLVRVGLDIIELVLRTIGGGTAPAPVPALAIPTGLTAPFTPIFAFTYEVELVVLRTVPPELLPDDEARMGGIGKPVALYRIALMSGGMGMRWMILTARQSAGAMNR